MILITSRSGSNPSSYRDDIEDFLKESGLNTRYRAFISGLDIIFKPRLDIENEEKIQRVMPTLRFASVSIPFTSILSAENVYYDPNDKIIKGDGLKDCENKVIRITSENGKDLDDYLKVLKNMYFYCKRRFSLRTAFSDEIIDQLNELVVSIRNITLSYSVKWNIAALDLLNNNCGPIPFLVDGEFVKQEITDELTKKIITSIMEYEY